MLYRRSIELLTLIVVTSACTTAQSVGRHKPSAPNPGQTQTFSLTARLVILDVVVTDKAGNVVPDLTRYDFTIYEDKEPQTILSFESPAQHHLAAGLQINSTADLSEVPEAPITILVLDELNTSFQDMSYARRELRKYLLSQPAILIEPTTLLVVSNTKFRVLHDYTRDRDALLTALAKHFPEYPWMLAQSGGNSPGAVERLATSMVSLQQIAQAMTGHPGRKNLIWVGRGFPGVEIDTSSNLTNQQADVLKEAFEHVIDTLREARVTLTLIDPTVNTTSTVDIETPDDLDTAEGANGENPFHGDLNFELLAPATGGTVFAGRNDVDTEIATTVRDSDNYYTLSYSPTNRDDKALPYRQISVTIDRPGMLATTRSGYYIEPAQAIERPTTRQEAKDLQLQLGLDLGNAIHSNIQYIGLPSTVSRVIDSPGTFVVHVDSHSLQWISQPDGNSQAEVTLLAASFGKRGNMASHTVQELTARQRTAELGAAQTATTDFTVSVVVPSNAVRLRFVVRDAISGKLGTADYDLANTY